MHFSLILIARQEQDVDDMMEPFCEYWDEDDPPTVEGVDDDGETYYYNSNGKWDLFRVGGRWSGLIEVGDSRVDSAPINTITRINPQRVHDVLTPDGVWHECETFRYDMVGDDGLPGVFVEDETFKTQFVERFLEPYQDCTAYVIDYHN